jgi:putative ABC transport system permease protein
MFKNYIVVALRNLFRNKLFVTINLIGLSMGMAASILLFFFARAELSFDKFHHDYERIYRVGATMRMTSDKSRVGMAIPGPLIRGIEDQIPEIESGAFLTWDMNAGIDEREEKPEVGGHDHYQGIPIRLRVSNQPFFEIFNFPLIEGNIDSVLTKQDQIVISETSAKELYGDESALGKVITLTRGLGTFRVSAVIKDVPKTSSLQFEALIPFREGITPKWWEDWENLGSLGYIRIQEGSNPDDVLAKMDAYARQNNFPKEYTLFLQPLKDAHLKSSHFSADWANFNRNDLTRISIYASASVLIMLIAVMNFINLSSARISRRAREVGIRKVSGAQKSHLVLQMLGESIGMALIAMTISAVLYELVVVNYAIPNMLDVHSIQSSPSILLIFALVAFAIGGLSGLYPAILFSNLLPATMLKGSFTTSKTGTRIRKLLVGIQYTLSIGLVIVVMLIINQVKYLTKLDLGYNRENVAFINVWNIEPDLRTSFMERISEVPGVIDVAGAQQLMSGGGEKYSIWRKDDIGMDNAISCPAVVVDEKLFDLMEMPIVEGRNFSLDFVSDPIESIIIDETLAISLKLDNPIGTMLEFEWEDTVLTREVIGVVKDAHLGRAWSEKEARFFSPVTRPAWRIFLKLEGKNHARISEDIKPIFEEFVPDNEFELGYFEDQFRRQFRRYYRFANEIGVFAIIAIIVSSLGLFGLTAYSTEQRGKEIAIRKTLGATETNLVKLLIWDALFGVVIASLIACPLAYFSMITWRAQFSYPAPINPVPFFISIIASLFIAVLTVGFVTMLASRKNPIDAIRSDAS